MKLCSVRFFRYPYWALIEPNGLLGTVDLPLSRLRLRIALKWSLMKPDNYIPTLSNTECEESKKKKKYCLYRNLETALLLFIIIRIILAQLTRLQNPLQLNAQNLNLPLQHQLLLVSTLHCFGYFPLHQLQLPKLLQRICQCNCLD